MFRQVAFSLFLVQKALSDELNLLVMADWGGQPDKPYTTTDEVDTAKIMGEVASSLPSGSKAVAGVGIGDNFYDDGVTNANDPRFDETFENVFTASSLKDLPFYFIAGNHDHHTNVTGEVARNGVGRWNYLDTWYSVTFDVPNSKKKLQIVFMDTVYACGDTYDSIDACKRLGINENDCPLEPRGPKDKLKAEDQWTWIENELSNSTADYLVVAGHYPVWSIAEHGPTSCLVDKLRPMLIKYNVTSYWCGHDHTFEYIVEQDYPNLGYLVTGSAHTCDSSTAHKDNIPKDSLKYHGCDDGGFTRVAVNDTKLTFYHYYGNSASKVVYSSSLKPRKV